MSLTLTIWLLIALAALAANLPFVNHRLLTVLPLPEGRKNLAIRLAELTFWYVVVGGIGLLLEHRAGQIYPQGWEFYVVTGSLFLTLAFPGFVYRYLYRRGR